MGLGSNLMPRARDPMRFWGGLCALVLLLVGFRSVLFEGRQFAYRDAGHFYYPLYRVVEREWEAGRWPLWNPWQNGGRPLLGMPMAAVFYPGKLLFAIAHYALAYRLYVVLHTIIAWLGMRLLARGFGLSSTGASLAAITYAFGAPIFLLQNNVIFLVGAAWAPWGFLAIHRLLSDRKRQASAELAVVLALQILGGDPEAAYLTLIFGAIYAGLLALPTTAQAASIFLRGRVLALFFPAVLLFWSALVCGVAYIAPSGNIPNSVLRSHVLWPSVLAGVLIVIGILIVAFQKAQLGTSRNRTLAMLAQLAGAGLLAAVLSAVQLGPACELAIHSQRLATRSATDLYAFSVEPYRLFEAIWPQFYGLEVPVNRTWIQAIPPAGERLTWSPSLYIGAFALVLCVGAAGLCRQKPWRSWLTIVAISSVVAAVGKFAGPLWWARCVPQLAAVLGSHDPWGSTRRIDGFLSDGAGSVYGLLATTLPGFGLFRYPAKLLVFSSLAVAGLAGLGWDRLIAGETRPTRRYCVGIITASVVILALGVALRGLIEAWLRRHVPPSPVFGPVDAAGAVNATLWALAQGGVFCAIGWALTAWASRRPQLAGALVLAATTADLGFADSRIVWTVPEGMLDRTPRIARLIEQAERSSPSPGPFRIQRVEQWHPVDFGRQRSEDRFQQLAAWEHDTLHGLYAQTVPLANTLNPGGVELDEYLEFFEVEISWDTDKQGSSGPTFVYSRRGYDLWDTRYFVMPVGLNGWMGEEQGFTRIYPEDDVVADPGRSRRWIAREGWQLLRNQAAMPRSWIVHAAVPIRPTARHSRQRAKLIQTLINSRSSPQRDPVAQPSIDLLQTALVETDKPEQLAGIMGRPWGDPSESLAITRAEPQSIELMAKLNRPGLVIVADLYYPGWRLTIDGTPAPILRTNRLMRGALVAEGTHRLVFDYQPDSFRVGGLISLAGCLAVGAVYFQGKGGFATERSQPS